MESKIRTSFATGITKNINWRRSSLQTLKQNILKSEVQILDALRNDLGKSEWEGRTTETGFIIADINHTLAHLTEWCEPKFVGVPLTSQPGHAKVIPTPKGTVLIIAPWNYPFQLAIAPLVAAIAAGNTAVVKPSELTPHVSSIIAKIIADSFPNGEVLCAEGGVDIATKLLNQPFGHFFFTGSTKIGKIVAHAAAEQLSTCTLELGGKSPCIVDRSVNLKQAARKIAWGKSLNVGQTCVAPDYILAHSEIHDKLIALIQTQWKSFYGDDPSLSPDYGRIVNRAHYDRLEVLLTSNSGTIHGGRRNPSKLYIEPTMISKVDTNHIAMQDEIFGPILPVLKWSTEEELHKILDHHPDPLALYIFSKNQKFIDSIISTRSFGGGCINHIAHHLACPDLAFGGIKKSGMGQYHGTFGFDTFSHMKSIYEASSSIDFSLKYPPYKTRAKWLKWLYL